MEESTTISQDGLNEVSLQSETTTCTVDTKTLEENGGDLAFGFSSETQNTSLVELGKKYFLTFINEGSESFILPLVIFASGIIASFFTDKLISFGSSPFEFHVMQVSTGPQLK